MSSVLSYNSTVSLDDEQTRIVMIVDQFQILHVFIVDHVCLFEEVRHPSLHDDCCMSFFISAFELTPFALVLENHEWMKAELCEG